MTSRSDPSDQASGAPAAIPTIAHLVEHAAHLLPAQGPIGVFVHHNTLHAFQHLSFEEAVPLAASIFGAEPYMTEEAFHRDMNRGRIRREDLEAVLATEPDAPVLRGRLTRRQLRLDLLQERVEESNVATLHWELEQGCLAHLKGSNLLAVCEEKRALLGISSATPPPALRPVADEILTAASAKCEPLLIRLAGAFLDQGMSYWPMPDRELGFYPAVRATIGLPGMLLPAGLQRLDAEFRRQQSLGLTATEAVADALEEFQVKPADRLAFLQRELLALPGWAGMFHRLEQEPELASFTPLSASLIDFLAVRLTLLRVAFRSLASRPFQELRPPENSAADDALLVSVRLALAATASGLTATDIEALGLDQVQRFWDEVEAFHSLERRRILHLAYERRHECQVLLPLAAHRQSTAIRKNRPRPAAQVFFCLDEREESTRRHLEEVDPEIETWGAAGFYGVAMSYAGIDDSHLAPLCPVVVKPQHTVLERPVQEHADTHVRRRAMRRLIGQWLRTQGFASRQLLSGWIATAVLGVFSVFPLALRVLSPRTYARLRNAVNETLVPRPETELAFTRSSEEMVQGLSQGFTIAEKADRVGGVLAGAGLNKNHARIIVVLGHGSTSLNNPHESAHDCGACGGRRGGPNGRLFAAMANRPKVRQELARRGIPIPDDTWFVGGYHDTCSDEIELYDLQHVPESHALDLDRVTRSLDKARALDAHERARRFEFAHPKDGPEAALRHVQERSEHLAEPRPEYGHCTNAVCIVGRRDITRGLFLDRRAFLVSYDASEDPGNEYLVRQLAAVVPVCGGISLEYYFSFVDNEAYGCGTKLPHNVSGLIGVMNGHASDLRTGLPWQMVEIHEPVRILFVIETTPERLQQVVESNAQVLEFVRNEWIRLSTIDPKTGEVHVYRHGTYARLETCQLDLPVARSSVEWYRNRREHLPIARIESRWEAA